MGGPDQGAQPGFSAELQQRFYAVRARGGGFRPELCASPIISPRISRPLNRRPLAWFNRGPFPALTARNVAAKWECGLCGEKCLSHCLRECALQDAGSRHAGGCRKAASTAWMIFALVPVPPSQRSARFLALPHSGWLTILELTCWVRGTNRQFWSNKGPGYTKLVRPNRLRQS